MPCPFRMNGYVDKCTDGCKSLEIIFTTSGLSSKDANYSSNNIMLTYAAITLSDLARDGGLVVRSFATKLRNKIGKLLPERLNQYLMAVDQKIASAEKSNVGLEKYLYSSGQMSSTIFNLATPPDSKYDKAFVSEAGSLTTQMMIMSDMETDLKEDTKSGNYNPLKNPQSHSLFKEIYKTASVKLTDIMSRTGIERIFPKNQYERNICSDRGDNIDGEKIIEACVVGAAINCFASLFYIRLFDLRNLPIIACKYEPVGKDWQWIFCEPQQTSTSACGCVRPEWYLWGLIGLGPLLLLASLLGLGISVYDPEYT